MLLVGTILFVVAQLASIHCVDLRFDKNVGYETATYKPCINNCINGQCVVDSGLKNRACTVSKDKPLIYNLFKKKGTCFSRCITEGYSWCYLDNDRNWEYCNPSAIIKWVRNQHFTDNYGPCKEPPKIYTCDRGRCSYKCRTYSGEQDFVIPEISYDYIAPMTQGGQKCLGRCTTYGGTTYNWCYGDKNQKWDYCALPALPPPRDWSNEIEGLFRNVRKPFSVKFNEENCRPGNNKTSLNDLAKAIQDDQRYTTINLKFNNNPVYKQVTESRNIGKPSNVIIPRLVRAEIRPRHLRDAGSGTTPKKYDDNVALMGMVEWDRAYKLVPNSLSGPDAFYNYVPSFDRNLSKFASHPDSIRKFLNDNPDPRVDLIVVPLYRGNQTRPRGIAKYIRFYNRDQLVKQYFEYLPNWLPGGDARDPESGPTTTVPTGAEKIANCIQ